MELRENERLDDLELNGLKIIQNPDKYCFSSDAVLLANLVDVKNGDTVCDLGTGSGIIAILLAAKTGAKRIDGLELQPDMADMARRSAEYNNLGKRVKIIEGDICKAKEYLERESYDIVVSNPPYKRADSGEKNEDIGVAMCRHEITVTLNEIVRTGSQLLRFGGKLNVIVKTERLAETVCLMKEHKIETKRIYLIKPKAEKQPDTVIVTGVKGGKSGVIVKELIVYNTDGTMTEQAKKLYNKR